MAEPNRTAVIRCVIVTPETTVLEATARSVALPLEDGSRGVARGHAPFIGSLGAGEVRITSGDAAGSVHSVFVDRGFVEVSHDTVTVVTQRAMKAEKLNVAEARASLAAIAAKPAIGDEAILAKLASQQAGREMLRIAERSR